MDYELQDAIDSLINGLRDFYHSPFVLALKIFAAIYIFILLVNIILLLIARDVPGSVRIGLRGMDIPLVPADKMQKRWNNIVARLKTANPSQYKVAIIEADALADELLGGIGYAGTNMSEKLEQVGPGHLDGHLEELKQVHEIRNRIVQEADFQVDETMAKAVIGVYENFLKYLEFLE